MKQWTTTQDFINNGKIPSSAQAGFIVETEGYYSKGDRGGAQWRFTGVAGQTPSQTPAQLGDALLNDANGFQWELIATDYVNIRALGCAGNGTTDDTLGIKAALTSSKIIYFPSGEYRITSSITIPKGCTVFGHNILGGKLQAASSKTDAFSSVVSVDFGEGVEDLGVGVTSVEDRTTYFNNSAFIMQTGSTIKGIGFDYPKQNMLNNDTTTNPPTKYGPAITIDYLAEGTAVRDVNLGNCYIGIDARKQHNACSIQNIYGAPLSIGIRTGSTTGFDDIQNVNFVLGNAYEDPTFPTQGMIDWVGANAKCVEQNRSTWIKFTNIKSFGYFIGIDIFDSPADNTNGLTQTASGQTCSYEGCGFDFCSIGIRGVNTFYLGIIGCNFTPKHKDQSLMADTYAIYLDNAGTSEYNIRVSDCSVHDADMDGFYFEGINNLSVSNNQIEEIAILKPGVGITVDNCDQAVIIGNTINGKDRAGTKGISAKNSSAIALTNNCLSDIASGPIEIDTISYSSIQGNTEISNTSQGLIFDVSGVTQYTNIIKNNVGTSINQDKNDSSIDANNILELDIGRSFVGFTGTGDIKGITSGFEGQLITFRFSSTATNIGMIDTDGATPQPNRLFLSSNYKFTFGDTMQLVSRGSLGWFEVSRSVN